MHSESFMNLSEMPSEPNDCVSCKCFIVSITSGTPTGAGRKGVLCDVLGIKVCGPWDSFCSMVCVSSYVLLPTLAKKLFSSSAFNFTFSNEWTVVVVFFDGTMSRKTFQVSAIFPLLF